MSVKTKSYSKKKNPYALKGTLARVTGIPFPSKALATRSEFKYENTRLTFQGGIRMDTGITAWAFPRSPSGALKWSSFSTIFDSFRVNALRVRFAFPDNNMDGIGLTDALMAPILLLDKPTSAVVMYDNDSFSTPSSYQVACEFDNSQIIPTHGVQSYEVGLSKLKAQNQVITLANYVEGEWCDCATPTNVVGAISMLLDRPLVATNPLQALPNCVRSVITVQEWDVTFRSRR